MSVKRTVTPRSPSAERRLRRATRGQAMVEYSLVTHFMLVGGALGLLPVMAKLFEALSTFYESIFFVLSSGAI